MTLTEVNQATQEQVIESETPIILEGIETSTPHKEISFGNFKLSFSLPPNYTEQELDRNYLSFATTEEFGPTITLEANPIIDGSMVRTNLDVLNLYSHLYKAWRFDRSEIITIDGVEFCLIMASDSLEDGQINHECILSHLDGDNSLEIRLMDGSFSYNYSPSEALIQMTAAANRLLKSIRILKLGD